MNEWNRAMMSVLYLLDGRSADSMGPTELNVANALVNSLLAHWDKDKTFQSAFGK